MRIVFVIEDRLGDGYAAEMRCRPLPMEEPDSVAFGLARQIEVLIRIDRQVRAVQKTADAKEPSTRGE
ncbi:MAG: hypothetical protein HY323_07145 [Betaproteobacteria bacterium]|nr:hypothetical protein [Betaproteobacteria bacterium]